jgi:hypothetical protein
MKRFICIHGHFYQPPRENPWLETVETEDSAYPFHDWNERITAECYAPNMASRILDNSGFLTGVRNNYSRISFNFGPTLLSWLEREAPDVYKAVLQADKDSMERFSGHGAAIAQVYNHLIMPLANERDRRTQVVWGIRDFERRFGRRPEGMWLAETAADTPSLEALAEQGIRFTILAPRQAEKTRRIGDRDWRDVSGERVDTTRPYLCRLPSGREITLFFYDGAVSRDVAFNHLLNDGRVFAERLLSAAPMNVGHDALAHIATDGETYGHHHRFGDMALASALDTIERDRSVELTIYGEFLDSHPPEFEAQIAESSSWSCVHGVERWRADCGCHTGAHPEWNQRWRAPLRQTMDWLRDAIDPLYETACFGLLNSPWLARDDYIDVVLDRSPGSFDRFLATHAVGELRGGERERAIKLMELQRHLLLMYTSCGWFFDEISAIEPVQVIEYAARAAQLARELFGVDFEPELLDRLYAAKSNIREHADGKEIYIRRVQPEVIDLRSVAAHSAISMLFKRDGSALTAFDIDVSGREDVAIGRVKFVTGAMSIASRVTLESVSCHFAALGMGDHNVSCGIAIADEGAPIASFREEFAAGIASRDVQELVRDIDRVFDGEQFTLRTLFRDEQRRILNMALQSAMEGAEGVYQALFEQQAPVMRFLRDLGSPAPQVFRTTAEYFLNAIIRKELEREDRPADFKWVHARLEDAKWLQVTLDNRGLGLLLEDTIHRSLLTFREGPADAAELRHVEDALAIARESQLEVDLWDAQIFTYEMASVDYVKAVKAAKTGDAGRKEWADLFSALAQVVKVKTP